MTKLKKKEQEKNSRRVALLGLLGTALTVFGTVTGALIGGATTVYKVMRSSEKLAISEPQGDKTLSVDIGQVDISLDDARELDGDEYQVFTDLGFVMMKAGDDWTDRGDLSYADLFIEQSVNLSPLIFFYSDVGWAWDEQPVRQYRTSEPVMVTYVDGSLENGYPVDITILMDDTVAFYNQFTVLTLDKQVVGDDFNLYGLALKWGELHRGGVNRIIAAENSPYVFEQVSWRLSHVEVDRKVTDLSLERWALFTEGEKHYYLVEIQYVPAAGQPARVWDDLQEYLHEFRVIELPGD